MPLAILFRRSYHISKATPKLLIHQQFRRDRRWSKLAKEVSQDGQRRRGILSQRVGQVGIRQKTLSYVRHGYAFLKIRWLDLTNNGARCGSVFSMNSSQLLGNPKEMQPA